MRKGYCIAVVAICLLFSVARATAPNPELLQKIHDGQIPTPIFMSDPSYRSTTGIDQGLAQPLYQPGAILSNMKFLVILVGFSDWAGQTSPSFFDHMVFDPGSGSWGPTLRDFYEHASYGNVTIVTMNSPSTTGWLTAPNSRAYYTWQGGMGTYGMGAYPNNSQGLFEWAVDAIDPLVDFANYDNNGDGYVDGVIMVHAGREAALTGNPEDIWSHAWGITPRLRDGVWLQNYCTVAECRLQFSPNDNTIGVLCHEFGHLLGLIDLYDYGNDSYGLGKWSLMAYGNWNGRTGGVDTVSGVSPAFLDGWSRSFLGFVTPTNVTCVMTDVQLPSIETTPTSYRLWTNGTIGPEYFIVEFRDGIYTDTALHTYGTTIYHIDENQADNNNQWWPGQPPANHYKVALEQADNLFNLEHMVNKIDNGDLYPGSTNNTSFSNTSAPTSRDYYGNPTLVSITAIQQYGYPDFDVGSTSLPSAPEPRFPADDSSVYSGFFQWYTTLCVLTYHFQLDNDSTFSSPLVNDSSIIYTYRSYPFSGDPDGIYYWRVRGKNSVGAGPWSNVWSIFLDRQAPYGCVASSPDTAHSSSFLVSWTAGTDPAPSGGLCCYSVLCDSGGGGSWEWQSWVDDLSATFTGARNGVKYKFWADVFDRAGNFESWGGYECSTYVEVSGCDYVIGDINNNHSVNGVDIVYAVSYLKGGNPPPVDCFPVCSLTPNPFYAAGDVNGNCAFNGIDITYFVRYLKLQVPSLLYCPDCPPAGL